MRASRRHALPRRLSCIVLTVLTAAVARAQTAPAEQAGEQGGARCDHCHRSEGQQFGNSVHAGVGIVCQDCHGGLASYPVAPASMTRWRESAERAVQGVPGQEKFDHGSGFRGKPTRRDVPERCGTCHSDVAKMNPYGLPTDQWAQYRLSGHGKALYERNDERVAVCIDCHGTHQILGPKNPASSVYPTHVPATCARCHADPEHMKGSRRTTRVYEEYRESVHGRGLLEQGDTGMPTCATCHGSHSAIPPGFRDIGHVCGRCHQNEERRFLESIHAKFSQFPRCLICHTDRTDPVSHLIQRVAVSPENMEKTVATVLTTMPAGTIDDPAVQEAYVARREPPVARYGAFCQRCHTKAREVGHREFFGDIDKMAVERGDQIFGLVRHAEMRYGDTARRVSKAQHGVLLVRDEAMMLEELRTLTVGMATLQHALDLDKLKEAVAAQDALAAQIDSSLALKIRNLRWRHWALVPMWAFIAVFVAALWIKYKQLKHALVKPMTPPDAQGALP